MKTAPACHSCLSAILANQPPVLLQIVINKFPEELVTSWSQVFFLPLVQRLTGDPSSSCREAVGACLKALMQRVSPDSVDKLAQYCLIWLAGDDGRLARTAAQVINYFTPYHSFPWLVTGNTCYL